MKYVNRILPLIAFLAIGGLLGLMIGRNSSSKQEAPAQPGEKPAGAAPQAPSGSVTLKAKAQQEAGVAIAVVESRTLPEVVRANGQLVMNEDQTWHVGAVTEGKVVRVLANVGDFVKEGQVLARMHSHAVHESRAAYQEAKAELDRTKASAALAERVNARAQRLLALRAMSQEQADQAANDVKAAKVAVVKAEAEVDKEYHHLTEFLDISAEDSGANEDPDRDAVPIKAPADGLIVRRLVTPGSVLSLGSEAFVITNPRSLWLIAAVNEADLAALRPGLPVNIRVRAFPATPFRGQIVQVNPEMDAETRTLKVRVLVPNPKQELKTEMFATAEIERDTSQAAIYVPESALQDLNGQSAVFVQTGEQSFVPRLVDAGSPVNGEVQVYRGLQPGDRIVVRGSFALKTELLKSSLQGE